MPKPTQRRAPKMSPAAKPRRSLFVGVDVGATKIGINAIGPDRRPVSPLWAQVPARTEDGPRATVEQIVAGVRLFLDENNHLHHHLLHLRQYILCLHSQMKN
ncbi:MAG TPA: hypothetical protein VEA69_25360 [Tepidisphaeraceae bacterium]|nr:hypothetical protein [Tepidisphaeraceae bacterium]